MNDANQNQDKFVVRLPDGMREQVKESAARNNRSMNAEIVHALEKYLASGFVIDTGPPVDPDTLKPSDLQEGDPVPLSPEVRAEMEQMVQQIADDATRRFTEWLWLNEADKPSDKE